MKQMMVVEAKDLRIRDVVGEGQTLWLIFYIWKENLVIGFWGGKQTPSHQLTWKKNDPVRIVRDVMDVEITMVDGGPYERKRNS